jgi:hypothetical protein
MSCKAQYAKALLIAGVAIMEQEELGHKFHFEVGYEIETHLSHLERSYSKPEHYGLRDPGRELCRSHKTLPRSA